MFFLAWTMVRIGGIIISYLDISSSFMPLEFLLSFSQLHVSGSRKWELERGTDPVLYLDLRMRRDLGVSF